MIKLVIPLRNDETNVLWRKSKPILTCANIHTWKNQSHEEESFSQNHTLCVHHSHDQILTWYWIYIEQFYHWLNVIFLEKFDFPRFLFQHNGSFLRIQFQVSIMDVWIVQNIPNKLPIAQYLFNWTIHVHCNCFQREMAEIRLSNNFKFQANTENPNWCKIYPVRIWSKLCQFLRSRVQWKILISWEVAIKYEWVVPRRFTIWQIFLSTLNSRCARDMKLETFS